MKPGGAASGRSEALERVAQRVQPERAQVERGAVELLEVEVRALAPLRVLARLQPEPLADLVRRGLPGPAQVPVELEPQVLVRYPAVRAKELPAKLRGPPLAGVEAEGVVPRDLQFEVHADVDDHPAGAEALAVQQAELVARVLQV